MSSIEEPSNWTTETLDHILHDGDKLYQNIDTEQQLLLPSDLPSCVTVNNRVCHIVTGKEAFGSFVQDITETKIILSALCELLQRTTTSALLCLGDKTGSSAIAVLTSNSSLFIFDSHSRDDSGMPCPNGTAVVMKFDNVANTVSYICRLAHELSARLFHLTFWHAQADVQCDCETTCDNPNISAVGILLHEEILKLQSDYTPELPRQHSRKEYYTSYKKKVRQSETVQQTTDRKLGDKIHKCRKRANETIEETAERKLSDKKCKHTRRVNETTEQSQHRKKADKIQKYKTRLSNKLKCRTIEDAMNNFKSECKKQPVYICTACHRLLWKKGVQHLNMNNYNSVDSGILNFVLAAKYRKYSADGLIYICLSCNKKLRSGTIPAQSKANCMDLEEIPDELKDLNNLELHTISKRILFMKLVKLPRGKHKGIKGATVNVPADLGPACTLLPRIPTEAHIISLKLKRKLEYRQAYLHDTIRPEKVISALHYLKSNNPLYTDIEINEDWIQTWQEMDQELYDGIFDIDEDGENNEETSQASHNNAKTDSDCSTMDPNDTEGKHDRHNNEEDNEDILAMEQNCNLRDLPIDTCLQCEVPEQANQIFSIAPGEGSKPIPLLTDKLFEELANPEKFPNGKGGYADTERHTRLTLQKYVNACLLDQDGRFAKDISRIHIWHAICCGA